VGRSCSSSSLHSLLRRYVGAAIAPMGLTAQNGNDDSGGLAFIKPAAHWLSHLMTNTHENTLWVFIFLML
jgi:hypothetical protein